MKRILLLLTFILLLTVFSVEGQVSKLMSDNNAQTMTVIPRATAIDFSCTFSDGFSTGDLFNTLDSGNSVLLDMFFTT